MSCFISIDDDDDDRDDSSNEWWLEPNSGELWIVLKMDWTIWWLIESMIGYMTIQSFVMMCVIVANTWWDWRCKHALSSNHLLLCGQSKACLDQQFPLCSCSHFILGPRTMRVALDCKYNSPSQKFPRIFLRVVYHKGKTSYLVVLLLLLFHSLLSNSTKIQSLPI